MTGGDTLAIDRIRVSILSTPIDDAVPMSFGRLNDRRVCLVEISAGGLTGIGESWINHPAWSHAERIATLCEGVAPHLFGRDALDPEGTLDALAAILVPVGRQAGAIGPIWQALSGVDIALWDLTGRARGLPVHQLLAGADLGRRIPAYASGVGPTDVEALCERALTAGFTAVKTKIGFGAAADDDIVRRTRELVGPDVQVFADANQAWSLDEALRAADRLARYDVAWLEEPLSGDGLADLEKFAAECEMPVATGENVYGQDVFAAYVDSGAVSLIQPDLAKSGGFTVGRQVVERARTRGVRVAPHCYSSAVGLAASVHLGAAYDIVDWIEMDVRANPLRTQLLAEPLSWHEGTVAAPAAPGLGIDLDQAALQQFRTRSKEMTAHD